MADLRRKDPDLHVGAPGFDEAVSIAWPFVLRDRLAHRAQSSERYRWWVLWSVLAGLFGVNVTFTIFAVALPRIAGELGTSENTLTWVITGPLLAFGVVAPVLGKAGDVFGHRRMYLLGMAGAALCAALSAAAWLAGSLIAFRTLGALEGAATGASSMALIFAQFDKEDRVKAMGWWSLVGAGGPVLGVAIGGPLIEHVGWRWIFAAQVPIVIAAIGLAAAVLRETERGSRERLDWRGALTLTLGVGAVLFALNRGPEWGWTSPAVIISFVVAPLGLVAFVQTERVVPNPLLPLAFLRRRNFVLPIAAQMFGNFAYMGGFILAPSLLARLFGYGESKIGFFVLSRPLAFSLAAPIAGYLAVKVGERLSAAVGLAAVTASMLAFAAVGDTRNDAIVLAALVLSGVGLGMSQPSLSSSVANSVDEDSLGIASAAQQMLTHVGVVGGIQVMKTVQTTQASSGLAGSFRTAYVVGAAVSVAGVAAAAFLRSERRTAD